jgi:hypothetical protein
VISNDTTGTLSGRGVFYGGFKSRSNISECKNNEDVVAGCYLDSMKDVDSDLHVCSAEMMKNCSGYLDVVLVLTGSNSDDKNSIRLAAGETNWISAVAGYLPNVTDAGVDLDAMTNTGDLDAQATATETWTSCPSQIAGHYGAVDMASCDRCQTDACMQITAEGCQTDDAASEVTTEIGISASLINLSEPSCVKNVIQRPVRHRVCKLTQQAVVLRTQSQTVHDQTLELLWSVTPVNCCRYLAGVPTLNLYPTQLQENRVFDTDDP